MQQTQTEIKELGGSKMEITCSLPYEAFAKYIKKATTNLTKEAEFPGFRKGHVPEKVLVQKIGENTILEEAAEIAIKEEFPKIIVEKNIEIIGRPNIAITKLAPKNPLEFKAQFYVMPKIELPDYKTIAKEIMAEKEETSATEKEINDTILEIQKLRTRQSGEGKEVKEEDLPELNDKFVKSLGDFKNVEDFKEKLKENIEAEKKRKVKDKKRVAVMEKIVDKMKTDLPEILIEGELDKMVVQFKDDVARAGGTFEEYLKHIKKTEEEIRKDWRKDAEKRAKFQLALNSIAKNENIHPEKKELEKQTSFLLERYKDADPENVRIYVETILTNEKVFEFLENQK